MIKTQFDEFHLKQRLKKMKEIIGLIKKSSVEQMDEFINRADVNLEKCLDKKDTIENVYDTYKVIKEK